MASGLLSRVQASDLLSSIPGKRADRSHRVRAISSLSTDITNLVSFSIVTAYDVKTRTATLKQWIWIAHMCLSMQNYETVMAIMSSLNSAAISRLRHTWSNLSDKVLDIVKELKEVTDFARNFAALRQKVKVAKGPCVPFLGVFLTDLTFADAGNSSTRAMTEAEAAGEGPRVVNFDKYMRLATILETVQGLQMPYHIQETPYVQEWLKVQLGNVRRQAQAEQGGSAEISSQIHELSLRIEPRESTPARVLQEEVQKSSILARRRLLASKTRGASLESIKPRMGLVQRISRPELRKMTSTP